MPKTGGEITRKKILETAEMLFSEKGFDGTGMEEIASKTGINKATIYYHFKSKNEIMEALIHIVLEELEEHLKSTGNDNALEKTDDVADKIQKEISFIMSKQKIISIMMMESLKSDDTNNFLFKCAELTINSEIQAHQNAYKLNLKKNLEKEYFVYEFFTGFIPFIMYVIFKDKWMKYFNMEEKELMKYFMKAFKNTHIEGHF